MKETIDYHIKSIWLSIVRMYNQIANKYDMSQASGFVLMNIDSENGIPATKIAPLVGMEATSLTRMLKNLEDKNLIFRQKDKDDGRMVRIFLTAEGERKSLVAKRVVKDFNETVLDGLSDRKLTIFYEVMGKINDSIETFKKVEQEKYE